MNALTHRTRRQTDTHLSLPAVCGCAMLVFIGTALVLLFVGALIAYSQADPGKVSLPAALAALYLSALFGGITAGRLSKAPLTTGSIYGAGCFLVTFLLSVLPFGTAACGFSILITVLARAGIIGVGILGALLGRKREKRPSSRRARRHH